MPEGNNAIQTNIALTETDARMLQKMMDDDFIDNRSLFIRRLIRQEWARRYSQPSLFRVEEAIEAGKALEDGNP